MNTRAFLSFVVATLAAGGLLAQVPESERIRITDPARLRAMGFRADTANVYVWSKADLKGSRGGVEDAGNLHDKEAETWGTQPGFTNVSPVQLEVIFPRYSDVVKDFQAAQCLDNSSFEDVLGAWAEAPIELPDGAKLDQFLFWAYDANPDRDLTVAVYETCQNEGANPPTFTLLAEPQTFLAIGQYFGFASLNGLTVDNKHCTY